MTKSNNKRTRLIEAADKLFHQKGISNTTLSKIAELANVPLGNVYYYFKSKDAIILAVIEYRKQLLEGLFAEWDLIASTKERLASFVTYSTNLAEEAAQFGDSLGSLCQELGKHGGSIGQSASELMGSILTWCEKQFVAIGQTSENAKKLALNLVASVQGINLITLTFNDPSYIGNHGQFLNEWLERL